MFRKTAVTTVALGSVLMGGLFAASPAFAAAPAQTPTVHGMADGAVIAIAAQDAQKFGGTKFDVSKIPLVLKNPQFYVVHGQPSSKGTQHGYNFQYLVKVKQGRAGVIELAYNSQTHTQLIEVGTPTANSVKAMQAEQVSSTTNKGTVQSSKGSAINSVAMSAGDPSGTATYDTIWEDPLNIHVNEVKDTIDWNYNGSTASPTNWSDYRWWLSNDGWYEVSGQHSLGDYAGGTEAGAYTYDKFENDIFCAGFSTYSWYQPNAVYGYPDGSSGGYSNTWSNGSSCAGLLHYYSLLNGVIQ